MRFFILRYLHEMFYFDDNHKEYGCIYYKNTTNLVYPIDLLTELSLVFGYDSTSFKGIIDKWAHEFFNYGKLTKYWTLEKMDASDGLIFAPYIMAQNTPIVTGIDVASRNTIDRYATRYVNPRYYGTLNIH